MSPTILLVDDHKVFLDGLELCLRRMPEEPNVLTAQTGTEALRQAQHTPPDVALLDMDLPDISGLELMRRFADVSPNTKIIFLSMMLEPAYILYATKSGAYGYLGKNVGADEVVQAVRKSLNGKRHFSSEAAVILAEHLHNESSPKPNLTLREIEIAKRIANGSTFADIGTELFISPRTVESHQRNILSKLGLKNSTELIRYAERKKW